MHITLTSPSLGLYVTTPRAPSRGQEAKLWRRSLYVTKSAPAHARHRRQPTDHCFSRNQDLMTVSGPSTPHRRSRRSTPSTRISVDDVISIAERAREVSSLENRRHILEEAQKTVRREAMNLDSRPQSVVGAGLQAMTSPMPLSIKDNFRNNQMDHIPALLPLPSDRTFIPSSDQDHNRHTTTPVEDLLLGERSQSVARQCCEIMGASMCRSCRRQESRLLNREKADHGCPRTRLSQRNISMTQIVKRFYPYMTEAEIHEKIARGEIAGDKFLSTKLSCQSERHISCTESEDPTVDDDGATRTSITSESDSTTKPKTDEKDKSSTKTNLFSTNPVYLLAKLTLKLKGEPSTPLFFTNLRTMQSKILSGEVERKTYMNKPTTGLSRLKSAVSTISTASSGKSNLSKIGLRLSEDFMPAFVSPRKVKIIEEPKYKTYFEPPLLEKRKQIPNPSFFAGSTDEYYLPERLPDVIEFADSQKISALEKQVRAMSAMSSTSNMSEEVLEFEKMSLLEKSDDGRSGSHLGRAEQGGDSPSASGSWPSEGRPPSTPRLMRVSTEGALSAKVVEEEEEENGHEQEIKENVSILQNDAKKIKSGGAEYVVSHGEIQSLTNTQLEGELYKEPSKTSDTDPETPTFFVTTGEEPESGDNENHKEEHLEDRNTLTKEGIESESKDTEEVENKEMKSHDRISEEEESSEDRIGDDSNNYGAECHHTNYNEQCEGNNGEIQDESKKTSGDEEQLDAVQEEDSEHHSNVEDNEEQENFKVGNDDAEDMDDNNDDDSEGDDDIVFEEESEENIHSRTGHVSVYSDDVYDDE